MRHINELNLVRPGKYDKPDPFPPPGTPILIAPPGGPVYKAVTSSWPSRVYFEDGRIEPAVQIDGFPGLWLLGRYVRAILTPEQYQYITLPDVTNVVRLLS